MIKHYRWTIIPGLFILLLGCGPAYTFQENIEIPQEGWTYPDTLCFHFEIQDTLMHYNLWLDIQHETSYPFQNIYTQFHTRYPDGSGKDQVLSIELADQSGQWNGTCRGNRCTLHIPLQNNAYFNQKGSYAICIEQYMRECPLPGIHSIQLAIERVKPDK